MTAALYTDDFTARTLAAKEALCFGEVAGALALHGSSRTGWDCPACGSRATLRERPDRKAGRCTLHGCRKEFGALSLVIGARRVGACDALQFLERVIAERASRGAQKWPGLIDQGETHGKG